MLETGGKHGTIYCLLGSLHGSINNIVFALCPFRGSTTSSKVGGDMLRLKNSFAAIIHICTFRQKKVKLIYQWLKYASCLFGQHSESWLTSDAFQLKQHLHFNFSCRFVAWNHIICKFGQSKENRILQDKFAFLSDLDLRHLWSKYVTLRQMLP